MRREVRPIGEIVRDIAAIRARHDAALARIDAGGACRATLVDLASAEAEHDAFERLCRRHSPDNLMAAGLLWNDELRHPAAPGLTARVRLEDQVEFEGAVVTIGEATRRVAAIAGRGAAIADWACGPIRLGDALALEHPVAAEEPTAPGANYQLF